MRGAMQQSKKQPKILVIHGPNLNMLGKREPEIYGQTTLAEINDRLQQLGAKLGLEVETFQSNHEGEIIDKIQHSLETFNGLIINPAAYTHTSIAVRDALILVNYPIIEIHLSNIHNREPFRHASMIADVATAQITGFGADGYTMAIEAMVRLIHQ